MTTPGVTARAGASGTGARTATNSAVRVMWQARSMAASWLSGFSRVARSQSSSAAVCGRSAARAFWPWPAPAPWRSANSTPSFPLKPAARLPVRTRKKRKNCVPVVAWRAWQGCPGRGIVLFVGSKPLKHPVLRPLRHFGSAKDDSDLLSGVLHVYLEQGVIATGYRPRSLRSGERAFRQRQGRSPIDAPGAMPPGPAQARPASPQAVVTGRRKTPRPWIMPRPAQIRSTL